MHILPATRPKPCLQYGSSHVPSSTMIEMLRRLYSFVLKIHWEGMTIGCPDFSFPQLKAFFVRALYDLDMIQIRNPNFEIRNNPEIQITKILNYSIR